MFLVFALAVPVNAFCAEEIEDIKPITSTSSSSGNVYLGIGAGCVLVGALTILLASNYESSYNDPRTYDQDSVKKDANAIRAVGIVEIGVGAVLALVGLNKLSVSKSTSVSIDSVGGTQMIVAKHTF